MPLQCSITQNTGVVATYHVLQSAVVNFKAAQASVTINSYLSSAAFQAQNMPVATFAADISPLVQNPIVASDSLVLSIENYILTTAQFTGGSIVS